MEFKNFKKDVEAAFNNMIAENLFVANVDKDLLWMGYLLSFEDETIRQDHNCNACKSFIRHYGKVVAIDPQTYKTKTFWDDVHTPGYEKTAQALAKLAVSYDEELAKSPRKSFITNDAPSNTELELKFNIVKEIITDKLKEKADREAAKNKAVEKARLTELLAKKQSEKLESLSEDEIKRRLAELG